MRRIAVFGGSFDPPHMGHVLCATWAWKVAGVDAVWVFPVYQHPYGKVLAAWDHRWAMCQRAFGGLGFVEVRDDERRNLEGRTFDLLQLLIADHRDVRFSLIGGTDTRDDLANWYRGEELMDMVDVIAVPRRGFDDDHQAALPAISSTMIRERLSVGTDVTELLPADVATYIQHHSIYNSGA